MANTIRKSLSFKRNVEPEVLEFLEKQSNYSDSILYLIQKEIAENGIRDMQLFIPSRRSIESLRELLNIKEVVEIKQSVEPVREQSIISSSIENEISDMKISSISNDKANDDSSKMTNKQERVVADPVYKMPVNEETVVDEKSNIEDEFGEYFN